MMGLDNLWKEGNLGKPTLKIVLYDLELMHQFQQHIVFRFGIGWTGTIKAVQDTKSYRLLLFVVAVLAGNEGLDEGLDKEEQRCLVGARELEKAPEVDGFGFVEELADRQWDTGEIYLFVKGVGDQFESWKAKMSWISCQF